MAKVLTVKGLEALKPDPARRREIADGGLQGLYHVIQPSGSRSWALRYRAGGKPRKLTIGGYPALSLADAREEGRKAARAVALGLDPAAEKQTTKAEEAERERNRDRDSVAALIELYHARHASKRRTGDEQLKLLRRELLPKWEDRRADSITRRDVVELLDAIVDRGAPASANRVLAIIRKMFNFAAARDMIPASPCAGVSPPSPIVARDRILSDDEIRWFWRATKAVGEPFGPWARFLLLTGQRRDEAATLRWRDVAGDLWTIPADVAKNGRAHQVPLSPDAQAIIEARPRIVGARGAVYAFTTRGDAPISGYSRAKIRLDALMLAEARKEAEAEGGDPETVEISRWTYHDLRRTAASGMARAGADVATVERLLNHVSGVFSGVAGTYQRHDFAAEMRRAAEAWAALLAELTGDSAAKKVVTLRRARARAAATS